PHLLQRGCQGARVGDAFEDGAVWRADSGQHPYTHVHTDGRVWAGYMRLLRAGEEDPESAYNPGALAGHGCSEDAGLALGHESFEPAGVLVGPDGTDTREGDVPAVGHDTDRARGEANPIAVAALL